MKHEPKNKMVAGPNTRRLMRLRSETEREESLSALLGQASQPDAGAKEAGSAIFRRLGYSLRAKKGAGESYCFWLIKREANGDK